MYLLLLINILPLSLTANAQQPEIAHANVVSNSKYECENACQAVKMKWNNYFIFYNTTGICGCSRLKAEQRCEYKIFAFCPLSAASVKKCPEGYDELERLTLSASDPRASMWHRYVVGEGTGFCLGDFLLKTNREYVRCLQRDPC